MMHTACLNSGSFNWNRKNKNNGSFNLHVQFPYFQFPWIRSNCMVTFIMLKSKRYGTNLLGFTWCAQTSSNHAKMCVKIAWDCAVTNRNFATISDKKKMPLVLITMHNDDAPCFVIKHKCANVRDSLECARYKNNAFVLYSQFRSLFSIDKKMIRNHNSEMAVCFLIKYIWSACLRWLIIILPLDCANIKLIRAWLNVK